MAEKLPQSEAASEKGAHEAGVDRPGNPNACQPLKKHNQPKSPDVNILATYCLVTGSGNVDP